MNLYGSWDKIPSDARIYIGALLQKGGYEELDAKVVSGEQRARDALVGFEQNYPGRTNESNVDSILENLRSKRESRNALLSQLQRIGMGEVQESVSEKDKSNK